MYRKMGEKWEKTTNRTSPGLLLTQQTFPPRLKAGIHSDAAWPKKIIERAAANWLWDLIFSYHHFVYGDLLRTNWISGDLTLFFSSKNDG